MPWLPGLLAVVVGEAADIPIDRQGVVSRHDVVVEAIDARSPLSVGNGAFAFTCDVTGLQTFPEAYATGMPLGTLSQWGWHRAPLPPGLRPTDFRDTSYTVQGRQVGYPVDAAGQEVLYRWLRENPHRLHLGRIGLDLRLRDGRPAAITDLAAIHQRLDLWSGTITSRFSLEGVAVEVRTACAGTRDAVAVHIRSPLVAEGRLRVTVAFPYGSPAMEAGDWTNPAAHRTTMTRRGGRRVDWDRQLDDDRHQVSLAWTGAATCDQDGPHHFRVSAPAGTDSLALVCAFAPQPMTGDLPDVDAAMTAGREHWRRYWTSGGAIDLAGSGDPRWRELERRIVLSQYQVGVNSGGSLPPQETGLVCNSWYGKAHLEMAWWHLAHFALWDRMEPFERNLGFYERILPVARDLARRQGYQGARWPKMVGPDGIGSPSPVAPLLCWQQPQPIHFAELCWRRHGDRATLERWREVVEDSAAFMADLVQPDAATGRCDLGPPLKTVSENTDARLTRNPAFELAYWRFGLRTAQSWRERLGLPRRAGWDAVLARLAPLPHDDETYLLQEGMADTFTRWNYEHPALVGIAGLLPPGDEVDPLRMRRTIERVAATWRWERKSWGWDYPLLAMAAARNGRPDLALDTLLLATANNTCLANGHFPQRRDLPLYLPANGGLLAAVAMMAAGWDGAPAGHAPGFPAKGWTVRWEDLRTLP